MLKAMSSRTPQAPHRRWSWRRHVLVWGGGGLGIIPVVLAVALVFGLQRTLLEQLTPALGRGFGLGSATVSVDRLDLRQIQVKAVELFPGAAADRATIAYDLSNPFAPKLLSATIAGARLHLILDERGLHFPDGSLLADRLAVFLGPADEAGEAPPAAAGMAAAATLAITGGTILVETARGPVTARLDGSVVLEGGRPREVTLAVRDATGYGARADLVAGATRGPDGTYTLDLTFDERTGTAQALKLALAGSLSLSEGSGPTAATLGGTLVLDEEPVIHLTANLSRDRALTAAFGADWAAAGDAPHHRLPRRGHLTLTLAGEPRRPCGADAGVAVGLNGQLDDWRLGPRQIDTARLALTARAELCDGTARLIPTAASQVELRGLRQEGSALALDRAVLGFAVGTAALAGDLDLTAVSAALGPLAASGTAGVPFDLTLDRLALETGGAAPLLATLAGATLTLPGQEMVLADLAVRFTGAVAAEGLAGHLAIERGRVFDRARDKRVAPDFALHGQADLTAGRVDFTARLDEPSGLLALDIAGHHDLAGAKGDARLTLAPLRFAPKQAKITDLVPALAGKVTNLRGGLGSHATLVWAPGRWDGTAELALADFGATTPQMELTGMTGTVRLSGLNPPRSRPGQILTIRQVLIGLGVGPVDLRFALRRDGKLAVERASWPFYGGEIRIDDALLDPAAVSNRLEVQVIGIDLATIAALSGYAGVLADGRLSGRVPLVIDAAGPRLVGGKLEADTPGGKLRLQDAELRAMVATERPELDFVFDVLTDFRYTLLSATIDGPLNGDLKLGLQIAGRNPAIEGGRPVEFNLAVEGPLRAIAQSGASLYNLGDTIGQRIIGGRTKANGQ